MVDTLRHEATARSKQELLVREEACTHNSDEYPGADVDDRLVLLFMATHPALAPEVRPALALRFVLGVPTATTARLFLVPETTTAARLTRAKSRIARSGIPFAVPDQRLGGGASPAGAGGSLPRHRTHVAETDWAAILRTYTRLEQITDSPIVRLNRAVAAGEVAGPMAGLAVLRAAVDRLPGHHRVALVRAELLRRDGSRAAADVAYAEAIAACPAGAERDHIAARRASLLP